MSSGVELIFAERRRQIEVEGFTPGHDHHEHDGSDDLAMAAAAYALPPHFRFDGFAKTSRTREWLWPWDSEYWKPSPDNRLRELVKAGALIAAEIDRLQTEEANLAN